MRAQGRREEKNRSEGRRDGGDEEELKLVGDKESFWMGEGGEESQQVAGGRPRREAQVEFGIWNLE
jgi:hypothetical protein